MRTGSELYAHFSLIVFILTSILNTIISAQHLDKQDQPGIEITSKLERPRGDLLLLPRSSKLRRDLTHSQSLVVAPASDFSSAQSTGQCPAYTNSIYQLNANSHSRSQNDRVSVDPETGKRTFNAKIVGIFSCLDQGQTNHGYGGGNGGGGGDGTRAGGLTQPGEQQHSPTSDLIVDFRLAKPAIDLAVRAVNKKYSQHIKFNITYRTAGDICRHQQAAGHAADEYYVNGANYFVGPGCSESLASVGQLASYWNVPICSTGYLPEIVTARFHPLTLVQVSLSVQSVGEILLELFQMYKWRHLVIVTDEKHPLHSLTRDGLLEFFHTMYKTSGLAGGTSNVPPVGVAAESNASGGGGGGANQPQQPYHINITTRNFAYSRNPHQAGGGHTKPPDYEQVILDAASMSRIMLLLARSSTVQHLLEAAHRNDMSRGQFVFIAHELFETQVLESGSGARGSSSGRGAAPGSGQYSQGGEQASASAHYDNATRGRGEEASASDGANGTSQSAHDDERQKYLLVDKIEIRGDDQLMREIFAPLMTISLRIPTTPEFDNFRSQVVSLSEREFNYRLQPASLKSLYSLGLAAFIYDCVSLYADKVNFILNQTQFSRIDGKTIFDLSAGRTFKGALTGDLTINRAGQRVIDFTLNDFSPRSLALEPIAHFYAIERRLVFLSGRVPHWTLRNQSTPRSDPRCRINDTDYCRYVEGDDLVMDATGQYHQLGDRNSLGVSRADRVVLGVWLVTIIVTSVTITSSIIGWLVYRRFRIESELLNLWWSIKYEDIIFEDDSEQLICDGKRSMSSLAISNESFSGTGGGQAVGGAAPGSLPAQRGAATHAGSPSVQQSGTNRHAGGGTDSGRTSPAMLAITGNAGENNYNCAQGGGPTLAKQPDVQSSTSVAQLSVGNALSAAGPAAHTAGTSAPVNTSLLSAAHSASSLSVGATSAVGVPVSEPHACATQQQQQHKHPIPNPNQKPGTLRAGAGPGQYCGESGSANQRRYAVSSSSGGASKLIPLLSGGANTKPVLHGTGMSRNVAGAGGHHSGGGSGKAPKSSSNAIGPPGNLGTGQAGVSAANAKDPSISSQNKYVKLRLGTILNGRDQTCTTKVGLYKASRVAAKHLNVRNLNINRQLLIELRQVRDLTHENLIKFIGLCPEEPNVAIVSELCTRGNLQDLLQNETIRLDWPFRFSIINDIVDGLTHLHSSPVQYHGRLKSSNCVIDNRFVVKLTDFGLPTLLASCEMDADEVNPRLLLWTAPEHLRTKYPLLSGSQKGDIYSLAIIFQEIITRCGPFECEPILCGSSEVGMSADLLAQQQAQQAQLQQQQQQQQQQQPPPPPMIRTTDCTSSASRALTTPQQRGVVRAGRGAANAVPPIRNSYLNLNLQQQQQMQLLQPVVVQHKQRLEPEEIVNLVRMGLSPPFRPYFRPDVVLAGSGCTQTADFNVGDLIAIVQSCWQEAPAARPTVTSVKAQIKKLRRGCHLDGANLMDNLLQRMERYTDNLESLVEQKTAELMEEKKRSEELLYEMLPRFVVDQLKYGHSVTPEAYDAVTISFSDIKDFTSIAAQSSPIEVVNLLNQLYTEFDDCIARYDVYKVETIGDAYMVVSGLPIRNGDLHAKEIAEMSLALLDLIGSFDVAHLPHVNLELRIGIHSGPCASGVVGTRMFRYCLFGDTVNTASRMESHGEPMKIHISEDSANILARFRTFTIEPRGQVDIKGKGLMNTYWLTGKRADL